MKKVIALASVGIVLLGLLCGCHDSNNSSAGVSAKQDISSFDDSAVTPHKEVSIDEATIERLREKTEAYNAGWSFGDPTGLLISYGDGREVLAPIRQTESMAGNGCSFYITDKLTAIVDGGLEEGQPVFVMISRDAGETWETKNIDIASDYAYQGKDIGFFSESSGYLFLRSVDGEFMVAFLTTDGGETWIEKGRCEIPENYATYGGTYVSLNNGYICGWHGDEPLCLTTTDSGTTWMNTQFDLPDDVKYDRMAIGLPAFEDENGLIPIVLRSDNADAKTVYMVTDDNGTTWSYYGEGLSQ
jgi:photosystem II stability/assembly factor-like uncharacterized protein